MGKEMSRIFEVFGAGAWDLWKQVTHDSLVKQGLEVFDL